MFAARQGDLLLALDARQELRQMRLRHMDGHGYQDRQLTPAVAASETIADI